MEKIWRTENRLGRTGGRLLNTFESTHDDKEASALSLPISRSQGFSNARGNKVRQLTIASRIVQAALILRFRVRHCA